MEKNVCSILPEDSILPEEIMFQVLDNRNYL